MPAIVAQLLACRGIDDPAVAQTFLQSKLADLRPPDDLPGCAAAADCILAAVASGRRIAVYGDYDVDGVAATSILLLCLRLLGADVTSYVPHRIEEGYGLNEEAVRQLAADGTRLIVTVDCGVTALAEADVAAHLGVELVISDHHRPGTALPKAAAIVHPGLPNQNYPFAGLSGAGVAFKLAWALCQRACRAPRVSEPMRHFLLQATALAALGTVADVVPLLDENRILVRHGLRSLQQVPTPGLQALLRVAGLERKAELSSEDVAFALAPRLNAAGRLGQAQLAIELLTTQSNDRAAALADYINELNASRQSLERSIYLRAHKQALDEFDPDNDAALVLADRGWHPGVIGIVAGRVVDKFNRPVVLVSLDELGAKPGIGSARSVPGFDLHEALVACAEHLLSFGGHRAAAGLKIEEQKLAGFREQFCQHAAAKLVDSDRIADLWIDAEAPLSAFNVDTVRHLEMLAPFGCGNTRPLVCATGVRLAEPPRRIGGGGRHLAMKIVQHGVTLRAVAFGGGDWEPELAALDRSFSIAFHPTINVYGGTRRVELQIADWRHDSPPAPPCSP
jgi:single-stranded-DNA-specific exonuclease